MIRAQLLAQTERLCTALRGRTWTDAEAALVRTEMAEFFRLLDLDRKG